MSLNNKSSWQVWLLQFPNQATLHINKIMDGCTLTSELGLIPVLLSNWRVLPNEKSRNQTRASVNERASTAPEKPNARPRNNIQSSAKSAKRTRKVAASTTTTWSISSPNPPQPDLRIENQVRCGDWRVFLVPSPGLCGICIEQRQHEEEEPNQISHSVSMSHNNDEERRDRVDNNGNNRYQPYQRPASGKKHMPLTRELVQASDLFRQFEPIWEIQSVRETHAKVERTNE